MCVYTCEVGAWIHFMEVNRLRLPVHRVFSPSLSGVPLSQSVLPLRSTLCCLTFSTHFLYLFVFVWLLCKSSPIVYVHVLFCSHCLLVFLIVGSFSCILPKYSQEALVDFHLTALCLFTATQNGEKVPESFLLIAVGAARRSSTFVGYEGVLSGKVYPSP